MSNQALFKQVYFHAVRRAMLENETILKFYMDNIAVNYSDEKLEKLDKLLVSIEDNDLFNIMMGYSSVDEYGDRFNTELLTEIINAAKTYTNKGS